MNHFIKIVFLVFIVNSAFSQSGWIQQYSRVTDTINSVNFVNSNTGWCVGNNSRILKTTNGGLNWSLQEISFEVDLYNVFFTSVNTGYISGDIGLTGFVGKTTNGGSNWNSISPPDALSLRSISFLNDEIGFVSEYNEDVSLEAKIHKTTNGGISWIAFKGVASFVYDVQFINETTGWLAGGALTMGACWISKTTNGGLNWNIQPQASRPVPFFCVTFLDSLNGWVSGSSLLNYPLIIKSTNGGSNWASVLPVWYTNIYSIHFINNNKGWAVGDDRVILSTSNSGLNWIIQTSELPGVSYRSVYFIDSLTGWVVGDSGKILKTTTGGWGPTNVSNSSTEIPDKYFLSQNYPNPFNPVTNLEFGIPKFGFVTLKIYDVLGNEVATLVNENKNPGTYNYQLSIINYHLSSGIYFYSLSIDGKLIETKRMILLK